jgi:hypothetical protein
MKISVMTPIGLMKYSDARWMIDRTMAPIMSGVLAMIATQEPCISQFPHRGVFMANRVTEIFRDGSIIHPEEFSRPKPGRVY